MQCYTSMEYYTSKYIFGIIFSEKHIVLCRRSGLKKCLYCYLACLWGKGLFCPGGGGLVSAVLFSVTHSESKTSGVSVSGPQGTSPNRKQREERTSEPKTLGDPGNEV
ncbi:hypothetical protein UPYG_G00293400 [Umbra pygmaea]|uniref:Uncharacterized protein n=1 Tax=Umbra pygmaea TaxID=75934 RepID=A0ABD0W6S8_UMBPY